MIANRNQRDSLADRLDHARTLVAQHGGGVPRRIGSRGGVEICVADAAGDQTHEHLAGGGIGKIDLLHHQRRPKLLQHRSSHLHREPSIGECNDSVTKAPHE